jgi:hypothetical protein
MGGVAEEGELLAGAVSAVDGAAGAAEGGGRSGHQILTVAYAVLRDGVAYRELGENYYDRRHGEKTKLRLMQRLMELGYRVEVTAVEGVEPAAEAAMPLVDGAVVEGARKRGRPRGDCGDRNEYVTREG